MVVSILTGSSLIGIADQCMYRLPGSPWGAGTFASSDGSRQPSKLELEIADIQGKSFYETVAKVKFD